MASKLRVTYVDGRTVDVITTPRAQTLTEQFLRGIDKKNQLQAAFYLAWVSLFRAGKESVDFEPWLDLIADVTKIDTLRQDIYDVLEGYELLETAEAAQILDLAKRVEAELDQTSERPDPTPLAPSPDTASS